MNYRSALKLTFALVCLAGNWPAAHVLGNGAVTMQSALLSVAETIEITSNRSGKLAKVSVTEGSIVEAGQVVAELDRIEMDLSLEQAELELEVARQQATDNIEIRRSENAHEVARNDLKRAEAVNERAPNSISNRELEKLRLSVDSTALDIEKAKRDFAIAQLNLKLKQVVMNLARHDLEMRSIKAPAPGMVVELYKHEGESVEAGDLVARTVRVDRLRAEGFVSAEQAALGLTGRKALLRVELPGRDPIEISGRVVFVSPEANPVDARVRVWSEFKRGKHPIRPGLRGDVLIPLAQ
jgi:multidrug resistance efflux pump